MKSSVLNIAFYKFADIAEPMAMRPQMRALCEGLALKGTVILSPEGINGFLAGLEGDVRSFLSTLRAMPEFHDLATKESWSENIPFGRLKIKLKKEIIPMGEPEISPARLTGRRMMPVQLKKLLDEKNDVLLLDTRNRYEIEKGTFVGAQDLGIDTFRQFGEALEKMPAETRKKPVVMFCTGGIRCEKATALALQKAGFSDVWQLEGGILKYFEECGHAHFRGDCYVFDERKALNSELVSKT